MYPDTCVPPPLTLTEVSAVPPTVTAAPDAIPAPLIVTNVPPEIVPDVGEMLETLSATTPEPV